MTTMTSISNTIPLKRYSNKLVSKKSWADLQRLAKQFFKFGQSYGHKNKQNLTSMVHFTKLVLPTNNIGAPIISEWNCARAAHARNWVKMLNHVHHENEFMWITIPSYWTKPDMQSRF